MGFKLPRLIPREEKFFDMFEALAGLVIEAAGELADLVKDLPDNAERHARNLKEIEHRGDDLAHEIINKVNRSFITPIDRGDIHALACGLDEIIDYVEVAGHKITLYELGTARREAVLMAEITLAAAKTVDKAVRALRNFPDAKQHLEEINRLEEEADHMSRDALANLFNHEKDPIAVIKWKEIIEVMEGTTDRCEDVANIVDGVIVKNA